MGDSKNDYSSAGDFYAAKNLIRRAQRILDALPADIYYRFDNDPGKMLAFLEDDNNRDEAILLGIVSKPVNEPFIDKIVIQKSRAACMRIYLSQDHLYIHHHDYM